MRTLFALVCFSVLLCSVSAAGFSASLTQSSGTLALNNGANSVTGGGGSWSTNGNAGFTDGQFQSDGGYIVPVSGVYHFDATMQIQVSTTAAPNEMTDIRLVRCASGCNSLCGNSGNVAQTLLQSGEFYLDAGFDTAAPPSYSLSVSFTGSFSTGDIIGVCVDSDANSGAVKLYCPTTQAACAFSGFLA